MITGGQFMEQISKQLLESQIRECYGRVVWSHKTQEKCADIINRRSDRLKLTQIILSALTTTGLIATIFGDALWVKIISAIVSAALLLLNTYLKSKDLGAIAQQHSDAAADIWNVRESYLSILTDLKMDDANIEIIKKRRDKLQEQLAVIYKGSPRTISKAYDEASKALKLNEEMTFSDEEIDSFLPVELRKVKK
ncbi:MAG: SLATT domain-containing protein [Bacteroidales bacterium]|nr:SLATT domain-containing protein [Bacteroidales bacterium]